MNILQEVAEKVVNNVDDNETMRFDPSFLLLIMELLENLIPLMQSWCNKDPENVIQTAKDPSWTERRVLKRQAIRVMGRRGYRAHGRQVTDAVLKTGGEVSTDDIRQLYEEF